MLSTFFGIAAIVLGLWGVSAWTTELLSFLKGMIPISLVFAGIIALIAGLSRLNTPHPAGAKKG